MSNSIKAAELRLDARRQYVKKKKTTFNNRILISCLSCLYAVVGLGPGVAA